MRTSTKVAGLALSIVAIPVAVYAYNAATAPSGDELRDRIIELGYVPKDPPVNFMTVGSLYYIDSKLKTFFPICKATVQDIKDISNTSPSEEFKRRLQRKGDLATGISFDIGSLIHGSATNSYLVNVGYSLTDVKIDEIDLGPNWAVFETLMNRPNCKPIAYHYLDSDGYVCQVVNILSATTEFKLDRDARTKLEAGAEGVPDNVKDIMKHAIEARSNEDVVDKDGRLLSGKALQYGVILTPTCLAPPHSRFQRVPYRTTVGRYWNYFLFNVVERLLPAKSDAADTDGPPNVEGSNKIAVKQFVVGLEHLIRRFERSLARLQRRPLEFLEI